MRELLKDLRNLTNEELLERLNYNQKKYNKFASSICRDKSIDYNLNLYLSNMNKIKKVFEERNIKIEFRKGWEVI